MSLSGLWLAFAAASVVAEPLDVRVVPVTEGTVQAIRDIHVDPKSVTARGSTPQPVGAVPGNGGPLRASRFHPGQRVTVRAGEVEPLGK